MFTGPAELAVGVVCGATAVDADVPDVGEGLVELRTALRSRNIPEMIAATTVAAPPISATLTSLLIFIVSVPL
jgi:hypothetical protein